jgi:RNA-directed DNA polymerase
MAEATDERAQRGRSLRSSPRTGKPSTGRRQVVDTLCKQEMDHVSDTVNTEFILDMQRKLYRWSTADPDKRFADLFNIVCDRGTLHRAWERLARNRGSNTPGSDRVTRKAVEERPDGVVGFLEDIRKELRQGTYRPQPVRQRLIPKPGKPGKFRPLGIPTLKDRLVQMALKLVLEPIFEADFYPISYGFRPGRSTHDALARVRHKLNPTSAGPSRTRYVIEGDIKGCFDAIDHHVLMDRVRRRIRDRKVRRLVHAFLKADIMIEGSLRHPVTGTPQGGIISPLLANIYLTAIDERYKRWVPNPREKTRVRAQQRLQSDYKRGRPGFYVVRYADDFVILVQGTIQNAEEERRALAQFLKEELRLELSIEKTKITDVRDGFDFLGYRVAQEQMPSTGRRVGMLFIPKSKSQMLRNSIKVKVRETPTGLTLADLIDDLNPVIVGWRNYYRYATRAWREFAKHDWWLYWRVKSWLGKKHGKASRRTLHRTYAGTGGKSSGWRMSGKALAKFAHANRLRYPDRGLRIPNGWNATVDERFRKGANKFWEATDALASLQGPPVAKAMHGEPDAGKLARPVRSGG